MLSIPVYWLDRKHDDYLLLDKDNPNPIKKILRDLAKEREMILMEISTRKLPEE